MTTTYSVRENENWVRSGGTKPASNRWEVIELEDGDFAAVCTSFDKKTDALASARLRQSDENVGVTVNGLARADAEHMAKSGLGPLA